MDPIYPTIRKTLKQMLQRTKLAAPLRAWSARCREKKQSKSGVGRPVFPPHSFKQDVLRKYAIAYNLRILVETGTQQGHMLAALKNEFAKLYSIELFPEYYEKARQRFRDDPQIELYCGDSTAVLPGVIAHLHEPALFWLDGHYNPNRAPSGERVTPILAELAHLFAAPRLGHVIIVDDVRLFNEFTGYPKLDVVLSIIEQDGGWDILIRDDSIRLTPRAQQFPSRKKQPLILDSVLERAQNG